MGCSAVAQRSATASLCCQWHVRAAGRARCGARLDANGRRNPNPRPHPPCSCQRGKHAHPAALHRFLQSIASHGAWAIIPLLRYLGT